MNAPDHLTTARLLLRRPLRSDAELIFSRYASDPEVAKFLGWPRHTSIEHTHLFLDFSDKEWERWPAGPYLIENEKDGRLLGSTGFTFEAPDRAMTGYVLAKEAWGFRLCNRSIERNHTPRRRLGDRTVRTLPPRPSGLSPGFGKMRLRMSGKTH